MKNSILLSVLLVVCVSSISFAQSAPMAAVSKIIVSGKVKNVVAADAAKGTKPEVIITDASGKELAVMVTPTTPIADKDGKPAMFSKLANGEMIAVQCKAAATGTVEAIAIKIIG